MPRLRVMSFSLSLDGYGAGPEQSLDNPMGVGGKGLHEWAFATRTFRTMFGQDGGSTGIDDQFAQRGFANIGAWILGRNMFGPVRGPWPDDAWKGWWGENPPYHCDVFVLTHHSRPPITMAGGTVFHFVTDGIEAALKRAMHAANGRDVRLGGGVAAIRQYLQEKLIDEMHLAVSPVLLGRGEHLFTGLDLPTLGYRPSEHVATELATHIVLTGDSSRKGHGTELHATSSMTAIDRMATCCFDAFAPWAFEIDRPRRDPAWQNGYAERLIGSIRWECVDHVVVLGEGHLKICLGSLALRTTWTRMRSLHARPDHVAADRSALRQTRRASRRI